MLGKHREARSQLSKNIARPQVFRGEDDQSDHEKRHARQDGQEQAQDAERNEEPAADQSGPFFRERFQPSPPPLQLRRSESCIIRRFLHLSGITR